VDSRFLDWHVPGLLSEKITALIRTLPKCYRKRLVPVADTVEIISREMPQGKGSLLTALSRFIFERFHVDIPVSAWDDELLDDHLKMRVAVTDPNGKTIRSGRD
jgi:ATP-dependent helicase HrpA